MPKVKKLNLYIAFLDLILLAFLVFDFGFSKFAGIKVYKAILLSLTLLGLIFFNVYKYWRYRHDRETQRKIRPTLTILLIILVVDAAFVTLDYQGSLIDTFYQDRMVIEYGLFFYYFIRLMFLMRIFYRLYFNPAIIFVGSYALVILAGAALLMLPAATTVPISFTDSLFTSTSAVCVTGLVVMDQGKDFTMFGQTVIMFLIEFGGIGMLTFTSFFAYFFKSGSSFKEGLFMRNVLGDDQLNNIMKTTVNVVVFALIVEAVGALFIYDAIRGLDDLQYGAIFFSVFHAVSAFCNGGFSTLSQNLQDPMVQHNYYFQWILMLLIIFGGLGYFISFNFFKYIKQFFINLFQKRKKKSTVRIITLNTKIVVYTTLLLIFGGAVLLMITEQNTVLNAHQTFFGKWTTAMFSSVTSRTCGFGTADYGSFSVAGLLITIFLMWVGASPASTGGGIKTSSFALATLNVFSTSRNKAYIEIGTRRVAPEAVRRAFAIIMLSLIANGIAILLVLVFDPQFSLMQVAFEVFSGYSTAGLSMGITSHLSEASKYVLIGSMYFGRIGLINLFAGFLRAVRTKEYEYPSENILIN